MSTGNLSEGQSFWDLKQYMRTVKRLESANKLCSDLSSLIHERANIENAYADNLKKWSSRWSSFIDSGLEYRSGAHPWLAACKEAEQISAIHKRISDDLINKDQAMLKKWQKEKFHKSTLPPTSIKEAKQLEADFESHQKPWAKKLKKVQSSKSDYHSATKSVRSLKIQLENAKSDPSGTQEQVKKIEEKLRKAEKDEEKTMESYKNALYELDADRPRYMDGLTSVFESAQEFELQRLEYFKEIFDSLHEHLDMSKVTEITEIYSDFKNTIGKSNPSEDLAYWSANHGVDMPANFPAFEEFTPELNAISKKKSNNDTGVTLVNISPAVPTSPPAINKMNNPDGGVLTDYLRSFVINNLKPIRASFHKSPDYVNHHETSTIKDETKNVKSPLTETGTVPIIRAETECPYDDRLNPFSQEDSSTVFHESSINQNSDCNRNPFDSDKESDPDVETRGEKDEGSSENIMKEENSLEGGPYDNEGTYEELDKGKS